jgi:hypothetical protein
MPTVFGISVNATFVDATRDFFAAHGAATGWTRLSKTFD